MCSSLQTESVSNNAPSVRCPPLFNFSLSCHQRYSCRRPASTHSFWINFVFRRGAFNFFLWICFANCHIEANWSLRNAWSWSTRWHRSKSTYHRPMDRRRLHSLRTICTSKIRLDEFLPGAHRLNAKLCTTPATTFRTTCQKAKKGEKSSSKRQAQKRHALVGVYTIALITSSTNTKRVTQIRTSAWSWAHTCDSDIQSTVALKFHL